MTDINASIAKQFAPRRTFFGARTLSAAHVHVARKPKPRPNLLGDTVVELRGSARSAELLPGVIAHSLLGARVWR